MSDLEELFAEALEARPVNLSSKGSARRDSMLEDLKSAISRRRRRRTALGWSGVAVVPVLVVALWLTSGGPGKPESAADKVAAPSEPIRTMPVLRNMDLEVVETHAGILERYVVTSPPVSPESFLDDDSLLALLAAANRPTGLIRIGQQVFLTAGVTGEPELEENR